MVHHTPILATIAAGLCIAFVFGAIAHRLRIPPLAGYLLAGICVGPFTPGYVADTGAALELAELGVILLMFGVGLHFSLRDLIAVKAIAIPGALVQIVFATALGAGLSALFGWGLGAAIVFGLSLSVASTVVLLRALADRRQLESIDGRIAIGWLIVEDLVMVLALVLLPPLAGLLGGDSGAAGGASTGQLLLTLAVTLAKVAAFVAFMLIVGRRVIPWALAHVVATGSKELFRLAVLAIALGVAFGSSTIFGVSFALGAFFAGMILGESELAHDAAEDILPLRDAFSVLFFVSVGMLFNPAILLERPFAVLATLIIIVLGKSLAAWAIVRLFRRSNETALTIAASLAQIGEFSFILAELGIRLGLLPSAGRDLILAGAILSIVLNPLMFKLISRQSAGKARHAEVPEPSAGALAAAALDGHVVLVGHGRVGSKIATALQAQHTPLVVIEDRAELVTPLRERGITSLCGNGVTPSLLQDANLAHAAVLMVAVPNVFEAARIGELAREINPKLVIISRADAMVEVDHLRAHGADQVVVGAQELARGMVRAYDMTSAASAAQAPASAAATGGASVTPDRAA